MGIILTGIGGIATLYSAYSNLLFPTRPVIAITGLIPATLLFLITKPQKNIPQKVRSYISVQAAIAVGFAIMIAIYELLTKVDLGLIFMTIPAL